MSEFIDTRADRANFRRQLLMTVSALALLTSVNMRDAKAADEDANRPTIWIELGGQAEHMGGQGDNFPVGFLAANPNSPVLKPVSPVQAQNPPPFDFAEEGKISFQPGGSNWVFSAAVNYGRSSNFKHVDQQTKETFRIGYISGIPTTHPTVHGTDIFADTQVHHRESHAILDFSAGKDFGLGMFGKNGSSTFSLGVRFAQFASNATLDARARPDIHFKNFTFAGYHHYTFKFPYFNTYHAAGRASRSFHGIGPSLSWNGSASVLGHPQDGEITFDWGANAAILFGRQKAHVQHQETGRYLSPFTYLYSTVYQHPPAGHDTDRTVTVPNVGGFAGATWRIENFKASLGYRADFFFGAIDGGIDARKNETTGFYGPFATISVGIGG